MNIILIGAGNLATNLAKALVKAGHTIPQVFSRTQASAQALAEQIGAQPTTDLDALGYNADVYVLSIKDSALRDVASRVCEGRTQGVFVHTAGSMPLDVFAGKAQHYGVLYPMQTFSKSREVDFSVIPTFVEWNDDQAKATVSALAESISRRVFNLSSADRKYLHLAAVWACNFANHCFDISAEILEQHNIPFNVMLPLIDETAAKVHSLSPRDAQTGPAVRYDENVIGAQAELLASHPQLQHLYLELSKSIHERRKG
jgi:predicted short-subunit dehydrogenase-like oxidoreductase (DUF2520 family)